MKNNYLEAILKQKKFEVEQLKNCVFPVQNLSNGKKFSKALQGQKLAVIAEIKRQSPSCGKLNEIKDPVHLAAKYSEGSVSALSVLTDSMHFGGSLRDLELIAKTTKTPILRKDFIIHPLQLQETALAGASAVLLIAGVLRGNLKNFIRTAENLGLETLTEVHTQEDLQIALEAEAPIIGINHRNLQTFEIDFDRSKLLRPLIPPHVISVAESGIHSAEQMQQLYEMGYDAVLIGEALVRSSNPIKTLHELRKKL